MKGKIIWDKVEVIPKNPHKSLENAIKEYENVYEKREENLFECSLGGSGSREIRFFREGSFEIQEFLEEKMKKISEHFHTNHNGKQYKHTVNIVKSGDMELLKVLKTNDDFCMFKRNGWEGIFRKYSGVRKEFFELTNRDCDRLNFYRLWKLHEKLIYYCAGNECSIKEARFVLMLGDKEFRDDYTSLTSAINERRNQYNSYKEFTDELDKLEEENV